MPRSSSWLRCALVSAIATPALATAQDLPPLFSYATYFECEPSQEARADALMRENFFPIFTRQVAAKRLNGWGWLAHNLGGHWRRVGFMVASSRDAVLDAQAAVLKEMQARRQAFTELSTICPRHDDYIWARVASSPQADGAPVRAAARSATYWQCDPAREPRVDSLTQQVFAPIYNRQLKPDGATSWSWHRHVVGGKYRRLLLFDGASHKAILTAIDSILAQGGRERPAESREFSQICYSHQDYLWDIRTPEQ
jgi:hypothetical protein